MPKLPRQPLSSANLPYELDTDQIENIPSPLLMHEQFVATWRIWVEYRARVIKKPYTVYGANLALRDLVKHLEHADPVEVINKSLQNRWQGLFADKVFSYEGREQKRSGVIL